MSKINFLKPDKSNLYTFLYLGSFLFFISFLDVLLNSFFDYGNIYIKSFIFLTLPSIFTIFISTKLLVSLNQNIIKKLFAYLLISIGLISLFNL